MYDSIYLLQTRESLYKNDNVFKVGRTSQDELKRFNNYPKGSKLHLHISCFDGVNVENEIMKVFSDKYSNAEIYGKEYFYGNMCDMMKDILNIIGLNFDSVHNHMKLCKMFKEKDDTIEVLKRSLEDMHQQNDNLRQLCNNLQQKCNTLQADIHASKSLSNQHERLHDNDYECSEIPLNVSNNYTYLENLKVQCNLCTKMMNKCHIFKHKLVCKKVPPNTCMYCKRVFNKRQAKSQHQKICKWNPMNMDDDDNVMKN